MATSSNLSSIIRFYAEKQKSPFIDLREFCTWIKKYAEHHVEEQAELVKYLGDPTNTVNAELQGLEQKHLASVIPNGSKKMIVSIAFFSAKYANTYSELLKNESVPYPTEPDLPKKFPTSILERKAASEYIVENIGKEPSKSQSLYVVVFARELPPLLLPACVPIKVLIESAQMKIRKILKKEEYHDYFIKKLRSANPSKEISVKNFYSSFVDKDYTGYIDVTDGDQYYLWNQLCYFVRQDFEKIQDRTADDTSLLQAISITEIHSTYLKEKFHTDRKREEALKELQSNLGAPPYFFSTPQILKFQDKNGKLLFGQYSEEDLKDTLLKLSTESEDNTLPKLVVFKVASGTRYYIYKNKVISLIVRLCNEAHDNIKEILVNSWYDAMIEYTRLPEMSDRLKFETKLEKLVEEHSPVLYALLNANFITLLAAEKNLDDSLQTFQLFVDGRLLPYSELLMLKSDDVMADAKLRLPFIYTIPIISWIIGLFRSHKIEKQKKKAAEEKARQEASDPMEILENSEGAKKGKSKHEVLAERAKELASEYVPEGSTVDRELNFLTKQWNRMISKEAYNNLTEDVNSLIRDYTRRVCNTLTAQTFTKDRIENLADALVRTPNMQKISDQRALTDYVRLYMIRLLSNPPKKS
ncbi:MAG: hypothetical protein IK102_02160 [Treponema sp.]|nr:hypothetical protein [Treponema sp.]